MREAAFSMNRRNTGPSILEDYEDEDESSYEPGNKYITNVASAETNI